MKTKELLSGIVFVFALQLAAAAAPPADEGKSLFIARCAACHNVNKQLTGPALAGLAERRSIDWIISFVRSSQTMIAKGDTTAAALFAQFNKTAMPDQKDLSDGDIKNILDYIKQETKIIAVDKAPFAKPGKLHPSYQPVNWQNNYAFFLFFFAVVAVLIAALYFSVTIADYKRKSGRLTVAGKVV
jgi:cytochrome c551/c552